MSIQSDKLDFSQPNNELSQIAEDQRKKLIPKNDFKPDNQYSTVHPDALADGDKSGRGIGSLDINNDSIGTSTDILKRKDELKVNKFSTNNPYYTVT